METFIQTGSTAGMSAELLAPLVLLNLLIYAGPALVVLITQLRTLRSATHIGTIDQGTIDQGTIDQGTIDRVGRTADVVPLRRPSVAPTEERRKRSEAA